MAISESESERVMTGITGPASLDELTVRLRGDLIVPGDPEYDAARRIHNAMIDRRPAAIARCADTADVVEAVRFARANGLIISIRGGGHGVAGNCVCEGGMMIDLSAMKGIEIDVAGRVAIAQAGLRLGEFILATEEHGLISPTGTASDTGIAGLTLGAGFGYLCGKYGLAIDNLLGMEVVTADGEVRHASVVEHPDLFWALRGGSGNFGVVTSFEFRLHPVPQVLGGILLHPFSRAGDLLRVYRDAAAAAPDELTLYAALLTVPDGNKAAGILVCWCGELDEGERAIASLRAYGPPIADLVKPMPYSEMNTLIDAASPAGKRDYWKQSLLRELSDDAIDAIVEHFARVPSPTTVVAIDHAHGEVHRVAPTATAFPHRDYSHSVIMLSMWDDTIDDDRNVAWTRMLSAAMRPYATGGVYVNEPMDEKPGAAYGVNYDRLVEIKNRYDPTNLFRGNLNIVPTVRH